MLEIKGTANCSDSSSSTDEDHKKCIEKNIQDVYDLKDMWNSDYWKTWYEGKLNSSNTSDKNKFQKLGSWEKFREICTKGIDEMIRKNEWSKLDNAMGPISAGDNQILNQNITYDECWQIKPVTKKK